jgi:AcrR family transcriptional regulator
MRTTKKITKRQLQAMETRNKLFETAKQLFMKHGFETVTIDEIVEEAVRLKGLFIHISIQRSDPA